MSIVYIHEDEAGAARLAAINSDKEGVLAAYKPSIEANERIARELDEAHEKVRMEQESEYTAAGAQATEVRRYIDTLKERRSLDCDIVDVMSHPTHDNICNLFEQNPLVGEQPVYPDIQGTTFEAMLERLQENPEAHALVASYAEEVSQVELFIKHRFPDHEKDVTWKVAAVEALLENGIQPTAMVAGYTYRTLLERKDWDETQLPVTVGDTTRTDTYKLARDLLRAEAQSQEMSASDLVAGLEEGADIHMLVVSAQERQESYSIEP